MSLRRSLPLLPLTLALLGSRGAAEDHRPECARPPPDADRIAAFLAAGCHLEWPHDRAAVRATGPTRPLAPHGKVRCWYSPEILDWLKKGRPAGGIPDGAMIYKEMFRWEGEELAGGAYMLKHKGVSWDGWYWGGYSTTRKTAWGAWANGGCLNCHASADTPELTFAALEHIDPSAVARSPAAAPEEAGLLADAHAPSHSNHIDAPARKSHAQVHRKAPRAPPPRADASARFTSLFAAPWAAANVDQYALPAEGNADDVFAGPTGPDAFLTSSNCSTCHRADAPTLMSLRAPDGIQPGKDWYLDISPFGEWSTSLMGLSGRDPVFHAQLEAEKALRPGDEAFLDQTCYRCHGVMGERQLQIDKKRPFRHAMLQAVSGDPDYKYGTLALDGISCTVCHHMSEKGLGTETVETGQFQIGLPGTLYGPYSERVRTLPMKQAIGFVPQVGPHVTRAALCGSCHSVKLPILEQGERALGGGGRAGHEQATYLEWRNSAYQDEQRPVSGSAKSCQGCHMPNVADAAIGAPALRSKIANIEEYLKTIPNSLPRSEISLARRSPYSRHTLVGLNYTVLEMFNQSGDLLGVPRPAPPDVGDPDKTVAPIDLTRWETLQLAQKSTARLAIIGVRKVGSRWEATVRTTNLAGHKFPSGVGFRRAFLEVRVTDGAGRVLWASGATDELGAIVGEAGRPLASEFTSDPSQIQPHYQVIERPDQVQIYEERNADDKGRLTIDFLGLYTRVKDNRLLPKGWRDAAHAPGTGELQPFAVGGDPSYSDASGSDEIVYRIPVAAASAGPLRLQATLYYQSIPPYYLRSLFALSSGREAQRLYYIASRLKLADTAIAGWKLPIASAAAALAP